MPADGHKIRQFKRDSFRIAGISLQITSGFSFRLRLSFRSNFHLVSNSNENERSHDKNQNVLYAGSEKKS